MNSIFKKSIELNMKIEKFLNTISDSLLLFNKIIKLYLDQETDTFEETFERIYALESEADQLETEIKTTLYKFLLLPDTRADVLSLIKSLDNIIDATEEVSKEFAIQKPQFPHELKTMVVELTDYTVKASEALLMATRAFFNELHLVNLHINKIKFFEHEADIIEDKISMTIFNEDIVDQLACKIQLKYFISKIASIADEAELIGDKLSIFTIKREI